MPRRRSRAACGPPRTPAGCSRGAAAVRRTSAARSSAAARLPARRRQPSVKATIERYKKANSDTTNSGTVAEVNAQHYQQESAKLRQTISSLQNSNRTLVGDAIHTMTLRDLKQLEARLEKGIAKIRARKNELLYAEVEYMQKREMDLQSDNMYLRSKVAENNERGQPSVNMMGAPSTSEYDHMAPYDSRNFLQVNIMQQPQHYSHQLQPTTLQLGYIYKQLSFLVCT
ncbi:MADS-box transcription factor 3 [Dichanthelium oligosanthes]|uniref:MADS-box transcription factor 3 n=1 Tax=Dichanthelium oligosanthes TaxID=888268 RepID=A0A1E5UJY2_9POAL|nr:MADS-box transcription factor 3 [Dichanthelium oligosanthes]